MFYLRHCPLKKLKVKHNRPTNIGEKEVRGSSQDLGLLDHRCGLPNFEDQTGRD